MGTKYENFFSDFENFRFRNFHFFSKKSEKKSEKSEKNLKNLKTAQKHQKTPKNDFPEKLHSFSLIFWLIFVSVRTCHDIKTKTKKVVGLGIFFPFSFIRFRTGIFNLKHFYVK